MAAHREPVGAASRFHRGAARGGPGLSGGGATLPCRSPRGAAAGGAHAGPYAACQATKARQGVLGRRMKSSCGGVRLTAAANL